MRFAHPALLLLALPVLAAAWRALKLESRRPALPFPGNPRTQGRILVGWAPLAAKTAVLLLLVAGLARPQRVSSRLQALGQGIDIMLAMDTSLSMAALDFKPGNRLDAAKETARRFVLGRAQDRMGLVVFGGATQLACPLTADSEALLSQLEGLEPGMTKTDGTALGDGIVSAVNHLKASDAKSRIAILLTDGRHNAGTIDPLTAARAALSFGIRVYTIGAAKKGTSLLPVDDPLRGRVLVPLEEDLDEELLSEIARITGGSYFRATNLRELREIYDTIDKLEKSQVRLPDIVSREELYPFPVLAAALLLLLEAALANTLLLRWP